MIKWFGTITSIIGAFLVASQLMLIGYIAFICGSISWLIIGVKSKDSAMITLNGVFFLANILGLYNAV